MVNYHMTNNKLRFIGYANKWVAFRKQDQYVVASSTNIKTLIAKLQKEDTRQISITKVPSDEYSYSL